VRDKRGGSGKKAKKGRESVKGKGKLEPSKPSPKKKKEKRGRKIHERRAGNLEKRK